MKCICCRRFRRSKEQNDIREGGEHRWHNYASGKVSPNDAACGRSVDKFHVVFDHSTNDMVRNTTDNKEYLLIRAQGDGFLDEQIVRMVGTTIAVYNNYLPAEYIPYSLDGNNICETPKSPSEFLFLRQCRYGFHTHFRSFFTGESTCSSSDRKVDAEEDSDPIKDVEPSTQYADELVHSMCSSAQASRSSVHTWLDSLCISSKALEERREMILARRDVFQLPPTTRVVLEPAPKAYESVLHLLRKADVSGNWPATSIARQKVINEDQKLLEMNPNSGSFSIGKTAQGSVPKGINYICNVSKSFW